MKTTLYNKLIRQYAAWPDNIINNTQLLLHNASDSDDKFIISSTVKQFKEFINSYDNRHNLTITVIPLFNDGTKYVKNSETFNQLNNLLDNYIIKPSFFETTYSIASVIVDSANKIVTYFKENPSRFLTYSLLLMSPPLNGAIVNSINNSDDATSLMLSNNSSAIASVDGQTGVCAQVTETCFTNSTAKIIGLIKEKIEIEDSYREKLSADQVKNKQEEMLSVATQYINYKENEEKLQEIFSSPNFKLKLVENFPDAPKGAGAGVYRKSKNEIHIQDVTTGCNDVSSTFQHEKEHAYITILRSKRNEDLNSDPFSNSKEQKALKIAIKKGDNRVLKEFSLLHQNYQKNTLTATDLKQYQQFTEALADYEPRCVSTYLRIDKKTRHKIKKYLKAGYPYLANGVYGRDLIKLDNGNYVLVGHYVQDPQDESQKPIAFIKDTNWRLQQYSQIYAENLKITDKEEMEKTALREMHAEINANSPALIKVFYPELDEYNKNLQKTLVEDEEKKSYALRP